MRRFGELILATSVGAEGEVGGGERCCACRNGWVKSERNVLNPFPVRLRAKKGVHRRGGGPASRILQSADGTLTDTSLSPPRPIATPLPSVHASGCHPLPVPDPESSEVAPSRPATQAPAEKPYRPV